MANFCFSCEIIFEKFHWQILQITHVARFKLIIIFAFIIFCFLRLNESSLHFFFLVELNTRLAFMQDTTSLSRLGLNSFFNCNVTLLQISSLDTFPLLFKVKALLRNYFRILHLFEFGGSCHNDSITERRCRWVRLDDLYG